MVRILLTLVLTSGMALFSRAEDLNTMLSFIPREANAIMVADLKAIMASPLAEKQGWRKRLTEETMVGLLPFPETAERAVVAEQLNPGSLQGKWELVLVSTSKAFSLSDIAKAEKSVVETIGTTSVCFTRRNTVVVQLSPTLMGVFSPAHRQDVARWLKGQTGKVNLTPALGKVDAMLKAGNQVALVFDLEETLDAAKVKPFLSIQKEVIEKKLDLEALSVVFSTLNTVSFAIKVEDSARSIMRVEFGRELGNFGGLVPGLIINAFDSIGGDLQEYRKGAVQQFPKAVEVTATLTNQGFRSTIGMIQPHSVAPNMARKDGKPEIDPIKELQRTFRSIQNTANSAHDQAEKSDNIARAMMIYDNAATKVDKLPVSHVDEEIQHFAADVSRSLREIASVLHAGVLEVQTLETKIRRDVNVNYVPSQYNLPNPWGFRFWNPTIPSVPQFDVKTNLPEIVQAQQEAITKAVRKRNELWKNLVDKSAALKKSLAAKHGVPF